MKLSIANLYAQLALLGGWGQVLGLVLAVLAVALAWSQHRKAMRSRDRRRTVAGPRRYHL